jgi:hypothetical protein
VYFWSGRDDLYAASFDLRPERCADADEACSTLAQRLRTDNFGNTASVSTQDAIDTSTALSDALWYMVFHEARPSGELTRNRQGPSAAIRQATLPPSAYHTALATAASEEEEPNAADARYWSDFSRAYYDPRSFQRLPALPDADGREAFARFDAVCPRPNSLRVGWLIERSAGCGPDGRGSAVIHRGVRSPAGTHLAADT